MIGALKDASALDKWTRQAFVPFDPVTKRTQATVVDPDGTTLTVVKGAPQAVLDAAHADQALTDQVNGIVADLAGKGFRALGVASSADQGKTWSYLGILPMFDPPRDDSAATIKLAHEKGVAVKMITGDDTAIAIETAKQLDMGTNILTAGDVFPSDMDPDHVPDHIVDTIEAADGFARVFPEHKYAIVKALQSRGHLVAMTGDGVNDVPALKQADCGVAVSGATDAARGAAALILTAPGLSVINSAIDRARQIFQRITSYTIYRVALTMDIMLVVVLSSIMAGYQPLTAVMIVIMSLLDDIPIMTIAYDNNDIPARPIRWRMPNLLATATILGFFSTVQSFGFLMFGYLSVHDHLDLAWFPLASTSALQTAVFLQLVSGGHLLLLVTRTEKSFFQRPYPAPILLGAIIATQVFATLMCGFGWLVEPISWPVIGVVWVFNLVCMVILAAIRRSIPKFLHFGTERHRHHRSLVTQRLNA